MGERCMSLTKIILLTILLVSCGGELTPIECGERTAADGYCFIKCRQRIPEVVDAVWHGDDEWLQVRRCLCITPDKEKIEFFKKGQDNG
jgi:hypothetical protein